MARNKWTEENSTSSSYFEKNNLPVNRLKYKFGQNFLRNKELAYELAELSLSDKNSFVFEIGAGAGEFTEAILKRDSCIISSEIDEDLHSYLNDKFAHYIENGDLSFIFGDAERINFADLYHIYEELTKLTQQSTSLQPNNIATFYYHKNIYTQDSHISLEPTCNDDNSFISKKLQFRIREFNSFRVCANLPYYLTREFLYKFFLEIPQADSFALMLQKEAAERLLAYLPNEKGYKRDLYGPLAIFRSLYGKGSIQKKMARSDFIPPPRVDSYFILLEKSKYNFIPELLDRNFADFVRCSFNRRRKTLLYNLRSYYFKDLIEVEDNISFSNNNDIKLSNNKKCINRDDLIHILNDLNYKDTIRAEELEPMDFVLIYRSIKLRD